MFQNLKYAFVFAVALAGITGAALPSPAVTQQDLVSKTQSMFDDAAKGDQTLWKEYFADDCLYFDEKGNNMNKSQILDDVTPLPKGYSGTIKITSAKSLIQGDTAILSYELHETENIFGQELRPARYHGTDTWMRRNGRWQIVARQMFRYYEDPAPMEIDPAILGDYVGVYELAPGVTLTISTDGKSLYGQRSGRPRDLMIPEAVDVFFRKGIEGRRVFHRGQDRKVDLLIDRRNNQDILWKKVAAGSRQAQ